MHHEDSTAIFTDKYIALSVDNSKLTISGTKYEDYINKV